MNKPPTGARYITTIRDVREVTLAGTADAEYWREQLSKEQLVPYLAGGKAQMALGGTILRWMGLQFRELTISVGVSNSPRGDTDDGWFLAAAFNSSVLLAAMERTLFKTPYTHAVLKVATGERPCVELGDYQGLRLAAQMNSRRPVQKTGVSWWEGSIFLPRAKGRARGRYFRARLGGPVTNYAWNGSSDSLVLPRPDDPIARMLRDSQFAPLEWRIRTAATHARSRTYDRAAAGQ